MVTSVGIFASFISTLFIGYGAANKTNIEDKLKGQMVISSLLMIVMLIPFLWFLPAQTNLDFGGTVYVASRWQIYACVISGLVAGALIGIITEYYTSNKY
jgi:Na+/H+-translocating membrane pyrophosphatase